MQEKQPYFVTTTVGAIAKTFAISADCHVALSYAHGDKSLSQAVGSNHRIVGINNLPISDASGFRHALTEMSESDVVVLEMESGSEVSQRVEINNSVECDGKPSKVAEPSPDALQEFYEEILPPGQSAALAASRTPPATFSSVNTPRGGGGRAMVAPANGAPQAYGSTSSTPRNVAGYAGSQPSFPGCQAASSFPGAGDTELDLFEVTPSSVEGFAAMAALHSRAMGSPERSATAATSAAATDTADRALQMVEFDKLGMSTRGGSSSGKMTCSSTTMEMGERTMKAYLMRSLAAVETGSCVICLCQDVNPIAEIELLAMAKSKQVVSIDLGVKLRLRPTLEQFADIFAAAVSEGAWFVVLHAQKSISTLTVLEGLLKDAHEHNLSGFHPDSKIIICTEPHPHFPRGLSSKAILMKLQSNLSSNASLSHSESLTNSSTRYRVATGQSMSSSRSLFNSSSAEAPRRRVRMSAAVDVVDIEPRQVIPRESRRTRSKTSPINVSGSVALVKTFEGAEGDKFFSVTFAGERGRFAVGSSNGNLYFYDAHGNSLMQAHAHEACIWEASFSSKYTFATGCEDGTVTEWQLAPLQDDADVATLVPTSATDLGADVYCVRYVRPEINSPLLVGGLQSTLLVQTHDGKLTEVPISSNAQSIRCLPSQPTAIVGCANGVISVFDVETCQGTMQLTEHSRKVPALTVHDDNLFFSGSFDKSILSWDIRAPNARAVHTMKLQNFVTGLDVDGMHLAAAVGENMYLWDIRMLGELMGGYPQGWKKLTRGIKVQSEAHLIVTASPDGYVRYWHYL